MRSHPGRRGSGTRFWPLSRELYPKQFLKITGAKTLHEETVHRLVGFVPLAKTYIVSNEKLAQDSGGPFPGLGSGSGPHLLEGPMEKNTVSAIGLAAIHSNANRGKRKKAQDRAQQAAPKRTVEIFR